MSSQLQTVADKTRALKAESISMVADWSSVAKGVEGLGRQAAALGRSGVDTRELVRLLDGAAKDVNSATKALTAFGEEAACFADRLAGSGNSNIGSGTLVRLLQAAPEAVVTLAMMIPLVTTVGDVGLAIDGLQNGDRRPATELIEKQVAGDIKDAAVERDSPRPRFVKPQPW